MIQEISSLDGSHVAYSECTLLPEDMKTQTNVVLPVLEAKSAEDIDMAFKQLHEGVDVEEVIVPSMIEKLQDQSANKSKLPVVEARSLEDIYKAFQQSPESSPAELPPSSGYTKTENNMVLPVLEARSAEDINLAFKQLHEGVDVEEVIVPSMIEKLQDHGDIKSKLPVVEARSLEDIHKVIHQPLESSQPELPHSSCLKNKSSKDTKTNTNVVLPVLEVKSAEDIDLAFKQLHEGVDVEEVIVPSMIEKLQDHGDIKSKLPVVEARSMEDIHKVFHQALDSSKPELPHSSGLKNKSSKVTKTEINGLLPVLEAKSAEDIDLAFKQLHEGVDVEEVIVPSMIEKLQDYTDDKEKLPVVEARSLEDIHKVIHQPLESSQPELPHSSCLKNKSSKDTKTNTNVVLPVLEVKSAEDIDLAFKQLHEGVDVEEVIVPSMIEKLQDHGDIKSKLPVVEARSMEDIHKVFHQALDSSKPELPHSSGLKNKSSKDTKTETNVPLPVLEAKSAEDIDLAFKQLHEGVDVEEVIVPSMIEKLQDYTDNKVKLPVVETRFLEDIHKNFQQAPESNPVEVLQSSDFRKELSKDSKTDNNMVLPILEARSAEDIDLAFKQLHEGVDVEEVILPSMIEKPKDHGDIKSKLPIVEARTLEDIHKAFHQAPEFSPAELPPSSGYTNTETNVVLPILEARSAEDIDLAFKQLHERVDVEEVIVPSMIEKPQDHGDIKLKLPVVEARSMEDIHKVFHQAPDSSKPELPHSSGLKNKSSKVTKTETNGLQPVLEAKTAEDIDLAFKQLYEGVDVEEVIVPSMIEKLQDHADNKAKLPVVEARSLEDIHKVFHQALESSQPELPHSSGLKNKSSKDTKTETNVLLPVLEVKSAEDIDLAFKQLHEGVHVEEVIVPSMIEKLQDHTDNKAKLPVVETRSLEDIHKYFQQAAESNPVEVLQSFDFRKELSKDSKTDNNVVLPILEARSAEDIDLAFKQLHEGVDVEEVIVPSMIEKPKNHGDIKSELPIVEARSLEDIHKAFRHAPESSPAELPFSSGYTNTETNVVLPVLEARSAEDIDMAFKQLHEGVDVEDVIVPSMIEKLQDHSDYKAKLPVVEARSLEDIHKVFHQAPESSPAELPPSSGYTKTETNVVLPVLEARSAEDIDLAFKQLHEGVDVEEVIVPSMIEKTQDHGDIKSKLPVVEAKSLEDLHNAFQQGIEPTPAERPHSSGTRNEPRP
ncbi:uncharacterized protein LOC120170115 [Hibiscus syriacus]|uniref:uncharacterized protein LOC120170115 n=1 Tax=Hibiscus syriacus TaxID=106335 RepID=UPI001921FFA6|nr:uncharacterized protein LOC120170115 [Hibiscus syriacus]